MPAGCGFPFPNASRTRQHFEKVKMAEWGHHIVNSGMQGLGWPGLMGWTKWLSRGRDEQEKP